MWSNETGEIYGVPRKLSTTSEYHLKMPYFLSQFSPVHRNETNDSAITRSAGSVPPADVVVLKPYPPRKALTMFSRAARVEGRNPPKNPISTENNSDATTDAGERAKLNVNSEKDVKFMVVTDTN